MKIGQASIGEGGKAHGGKAGDQTGGEVKISNWYKYSKGWDVVIRAKSRDKAHKMAEAMKAACNNNNIGYDQWERETLLTQVKKVGNDFSKVTTPTETDCSALIATVIVATGTEESKMRNPSRKNALAYTGDLKQLCAATGEFDILTDSKYLNSSDYLLEGDIILNERYHVIMAIENGSASSSAPTVRDLRRGSKGEDVKELQKNLNTVLGTRLTVDGDFGKNTENAVKQFQTKYGLKVDGIYGKNSRAAMATALSAPKPNPVSQPQAANKVKVTSKTGLNVRRGPGTNYSVVKVLAYNTTISILEEQSGWGKIGNEQYVSLRYTAKI